MEVRVYYESLEQGQHYVIDSLRKLFPTIEFVLVRKSQQTYLQSGFSKKFGKHLSKILIRKNPDLIITAINGRIEEPIVVIEFSTAVFTKDHEQQRSDNFLLPLRNNVIYIKVSSTGKDSGGHGGDVSYNPIEPFALCFQRKGILSFHIEWPTQDGNLKFVSKHSEYRSLPKNNAYFTSLLEVILKCYMHFGYANYRQEVEIECRRSLVFSDWISRLESYTSFEDIRSLRSRRTEWFDYHHGISESNVFVLKFNRMGHAMDPERGMLVHYRTFLSQGSEIFVSKLVFTPGSQTWFKATGAEQRIKALTKDKSNFSGEELLEFLILGLSLPESDILRSIVKSSTSEVFDVSSWVRIAFVRMNVAFRTIIENSSYLQLTDGFGCDIYLKWDLSLADYDFSDLPDNSVLELSKELTEDDVTYLSVHNVLRPNGIDILSVSYPGAQSDTPILPDVSAGRRQRRLYIDIVGFIGQEMLLQENKGPFKLREVQGDIEKLTLFKTDDNYKLALEQFCSEHEREVLRIRLGIGFAKSGRLVSQLRDVGIDVVDYFVVFDNDNQTWKLYSSIEQELFQVKNGSFTLPLSFVVSSS